MVVHWPDGTPSKRSPGHLGSGSWQWTPRNVRCRSHLSRRPWLSQLARLGSTDTRQELASWHMIHMCTWNWIVNHSNGAWNIFYTVYYERNFTTYTCTWKKPCTGQKLMQILASGYRLFLEICTWQEHAVCTLNLEEACASPWHKLTLPYSQ